MRQHGTLRGHSGRAHTMPLTPYLQEVVFEPDRLEQLTRTYLAVCKTLGLIDRDDPMTAIVARTVVDLGKNTGESDPETIHDLVVQAFHAKRSA